jgi:hypothetical protein
MHDQPVYYFGCLRGVGHYLHDPAAAGWRGYKAERNPDGWPEAWRSYYPGAVLDDAALMFGPCKDQTEGVPVLHHVEGWTALAFWDRSVDKRGGSKSVFVTRGTLDCPAMIEAARAAWPQVWARYAFAVECAQ